MNEPLITLNSVWGLDLKWVVQEKEGLFSIFSSLIRNTDFYINVGTGLSCASYIQESITKFVYQVVLIRLHNSDVRNC